MSKEILTDADKELEKTEAGKKIWSLITYGLYAIGWMVSLVGIIVGGRENFVSE